MNEDVRRKIDPYFDKLEKREINRNQFLDEVSKVLGPFRPAGVDPAYAPPLNPQTSGVLVRVVDVDENGRNLIEGVVRPNALPFWQRLSDGEWQQTIVSGLAVLEIDGRRQTYQAGETITVRPRHKFSFVNEGNKPWRFKARHPVWQPDRFSYGLNGTEFAGDDIWFCLRPTPEDTALRPAYRILPSAPAMSSAATKSGGDPLATDCVAWVPTGARMMRQVDTAGSGVVRMLDGEADFEIQSLAESTQLAGSIQKEGALRVKRLGRGETLELGHREVLGLAAGARRGGAPALMLIQPDPPRAWKPETTLWELDEGEFHTGDQVWFEMIFPGRAQ